MANKTETIGTSSTQRAAGKAFPTVLQVIPTLETGGAERTTLDVAAAIVAAGGRALVASAGGRMVAALEASGATHIPLPVDSKNPFALFANAQRLASVIRTEQVDIIHARSRAPAWSALIAAKRTGIAFVTTYHGAYKQANAVKALYNSSMTRSDAIIANSQWTRDLILEREPRSRDRITVIHRGTDMAAFDRGAIEPARLARLRTAWGVAPDTRIVLHLARVTRWKGQAVLVEAAQLLALRGEERFTVILAGDAQGRDSYVGELEAGIAASGLDERVKLVGHCDDPAAAMALADVAVVASIEPEAFGRAAVEAQALGTPVIVTDLGAVGETVLAPPAVPGTERTGWKVPASNAPAMAAALAEALALSDDARQALARRARHHVEAHFSLSAMTDATLAIYRRLSG
jgi:glycosyltransferase involved in cell wall biosynthesis